MLIALAVTHIPALAKLTVILLPLIILQTHFNASYIGASYVDIPFRKELVGKRTQGSWGNVIRKERNGENAYEELMISIETDVPEDLAEKLIPAIKETMTEFSKALYTATKNTQYMRKINIRIPYEWNNVPVDNAANLKFSQSAEILVASPVSPFLDQPYTRRNGGCGVSGLFIHITPAFILKHHKACQWRPRGLLMVREWAKYRWGVYDEIGYPNDEYYPLYIIGKRGYQLNACMPEDVKGKYIDISSDKVCTKYNITYETFKNTSCRWYPRNSEEIGTSLMALPAIRNKDGSFKENVKHLSDEYSEHDHRHGKTEQDIKCQLSIWHTMQMHPDFRDFSYVKYQDPEFTVVRGINPTYMFVIDWSKSMAEGDDNLPRLTRKDKVKKYVADWIYYELFDNSTIGIILFSDTAKVVCEMMEIKSENDRKKVIKSYTTHHQQGDFTCIGCGVKLALTKLMGIQNAHIILMTDGEHNTDIPIQNVEAELVHSGIILHSIVIGDAADRGIEGMALKTDGLSYMLSDEDVGYDLMLALLRIQEYAEFREPQECVHLTVESPQGSVHQAHWSISEAQARNDMHFRITTDHHGRIRKGTKITFPNGTIKILGWRNKIKYTGMHHLYTYETLLRDLQPGMYFSTTILNTQHKNELVLTKVSIIRTTTNKNDWQPVKALAWVSSGANTIDPCRFDMVEHPVIIYCDISVEHRPVIGAQVVSRITHPCPSGEFKSRNCKSRLPATGIFLRDNGISPDETENDGIYSAYFTRYSSAGRYSISVHISSNNDTKVNDERYDFNSSDIEYEQHPMSQECKHKEYIGGSRLPTKEGKQIAIDKSIIAGIIKTVDHSQLTCQLNKIQYPPAKITDLSVTLRNNKENILYLSWTAPGNDYFDNGIVDNYELRYGMNENEIKEDDLERTKLIDITKELLNQNKTVFVYPGWKAKLQDIYTEWMECNTAYYFIIKAIDKDFLKSATSNAAAVMHKCPLKPEDFNLYIKPIQNDNKVILQLNWIVPTKVFEYRIWLSQIIVKGKVRLQAYINATQIIKEDIYKYKPGDNVTVNTITLDFLPVNKVILVALHITYFGGRDNMLSNSAEFIIENVTIIEDLQILTVLPVDLEGLYQIHLTWTVPEEVSKYQLYISEDETPYHNNSNDLLGITIRNGELDFGKERKTQFLTKSMKLKNGRKFYAWLLVYYFNNTFHRKSNLEFSIATKLPEKVNDFAVMVQPNAHNQKYNLHLIWTAPKYVDSYDARYGIGNNDAFETWESIKVPMLDKATIKEGDVVNIVSAPMDLSSDVEYSAILKVYHFDGLESIFSNVEKFQPMEIHSLIDYFKTEPITNISSYKYQRSKEWTIPNYESSNSQVYNIEADGLYHFNSINKETEGMLGRTNLTEPIDNDDEYYYYDDNDDYDNDDDDDEWGKDEKEDDKKYWGKNDSDINHLIKKVEEFHPIIYVTEGPTEPFDNADEEYGDDEDEEDNEDDEGKEREEVIGDDEDEDDDKNWQMDYANVNQVMRYDIENNEKEEKEDNKVDYDKEDGDEEDEDEMVENDPDEDEEEKDEDEDDYEDVDKNGKKDYANVNHVMGHTIDNNEKEVMEDNKVDYDKEDEDEDEDDEEDKDEEDEKENEDEDEDEYEDVDQNRQKDYANVNHVMGHAIKNNVKEEKEDNKAHYGKKDEDEDEDVEVEDEEDEDDKKEEVEEEKEEDEDEDGDEYEDDNKNGKKDYANVNNFMKKAYEEDNDLNNIEAKDYTEDDIVNDNGNIANDEQKEKDINMEEEDDEDNVREMYGIRINTKCNRIIP